MLALWRLGEGREEFEPEPDKNKSLSAQERVEWFVAHYPTRMGFVEDLLAKADKLRRQIRTRDAARSAGARTALEDTEKISVTSQRNSRELNQALREYERLRSRELPTPAASLTRNEPTDGPNT
jgi:hypothetical protein